jgi:ATP-dependent Zn protease
MARLIWALGAMAAERVFYGENSTGVGGDVQAATDRASWMVGACGMAPEYVELRCDDESEEEARERIMKRFQRIGTQIVNRTNVGSAESAVLHDPSQRQMVEQMLGQAYLAAHHLVETNRQAVEHIADELVAKRELYGDEVLHLLDAQRLTLPEVDLTKDEAWPRL